MAKIAKSILLSGLIFAAGGCSTTLRCGTDGDASYVDLISVRDIPTNARYFTELCGFNYQQEIN